MKQIVDYLTVAAAAASLTAIAACSQMSSVVSVAATDAPRVASALETICNDLVPAAEATVNTLAKGGAAATIQSTEAKYVTPACVAARSAATAVDSGWLASVVASLVTTAANGQVTATSAPSGGGN